MAVNHFIYSAMYSIYVIQSRIDKRIYVGLSANVEKRVEDHNSGRVFSTKGYRPWILVYTEKVGSRKEARERERFFKSGCGKEYIKLTILG